MKKSLLVLVLVFRVMLMLGFASAANGGGSPDADGLANSIETNVYSTDPLDWDSDNDGISDGLEVGMMTNPIDGAGPATTDSDEDGYGDDIEAMYQTNPQVWDSDNDGYGDGFEISSAMNPLLADSPYFGIDSDHDDLSDNLEDNLLGTSPNAWDSDTDGYGDDVELVYGSSPINPMDYPLVSGGGGGLGGAAVTSSIDWDYRNVVGLLAVALIMVIALLAYTMKKK